MVLGVLISSALTLAAGASVVQPTFEQALEGIRARVVDTRRAQIKAKVRQELVAASQEARLLASDARSLRWSVADARRRAYNQRTQRPPRPDPFLRSLVQRVLWDARGQARDVSRLSRDAEEISSRAKKDPEAVSAAEAFAADSRRMATDCEWLASEARLASWELRSAGYAFEAMDIERAAGDAARDARAAKRTADDILAKIKPD